MADKRYSTVKRRWEIRVTYTWVTHFRGTRQEAIAEQECLAGHGNEGGPQYVSNTLRAS